MYFFFNDTATTEIYTLSLHDALPISIRIRTTIRSCTWPFELRTTRRSWTGSSTATSSAEESCHGRTRNRTHSSPSRRSEEHTSELQSRQYLVCRLLLEKKKLKKDPAS